MLNRKKSNLIFYGTLVAILLVTLVVRVFVLGTLNTKIETVTVSNRMLQTQIEVLRETVQDNKDKQTEQIFELYDEVPSIFNQTDLTLFTIAQLELAGIDEKNATQRSVLINDNFTLPADSNFKSIKNDFKIVEIQIYFNTTSTDNVELFLDILNEGEQVFILNSIEYYAPDGTNYIGVSINLLAFYELDSTQ